MSNRIGAVDIQAQSRFFKSVGAMLGAGMPVVNCLRCEEGKSNGRVRAMAHAMRGSVESGSTLSQAMGALKGTFDPVVVGMVRAAESSGKLSETMARIATMQEATVRLRKRIRSAMVYPTVVLVIALAVSWFLASFILPVLTGLLEGRTPPLPTRLVMGAGAWIRGSGLYVMIALIALGVVASLARQTREGARFLQRFQWRIPVAGRVVRKVAIARFARVYGSLVQSGVPVVQALELSAGAAGNCEVEDAVLRARTAVQQGENLSIALAGERSMPVELLEMLRSGEKSGRVDEMLDSIATYYEQDVDAVLSMLPALIHPVLIIFVGIIVLIVALSVFMPIWGMVNAM